ncbi:hypothetical protein NDU88_004330 [Pleurodeles waltl]|uniref:Uncharacterized protein n=1 Tax=Pleurodeles waltl TaxID=8319 RepID=A0AAV7SII8_PLEWA|nr:hypothetical protein NDU88_004330 [Pleurodeles waltl]
MQNLGHHAKKCLKKGERHARLPRNCTAALAASRLGASEHAVDLDVGLSPVTVTLGYIIPPISPESWEELEKMISEEEIQEVFKGLTSNKGPDLDSDLDLRQSPSEPRLWMI